MRRILALLHEPDGAHAVLAAAGLVAASLAGTVTALHVHPENGEIPGEEIIPQAERHRRDHAEEIRAAALHAAFTATALPHAVWLKRPGPTRACVAAESRAAALVVLNRPPRRFYQHMREALCGALLDAAAPVLLVDNAVPAVLGAHIAVAWKPGVPAERAIAAALSLLREASHVTILIANDTGAEGPLPDELLDELERQGVAPAIEVFRPNTSTGLALGQQAHALGADLLVMGAFSRSRTQERVFGGATQDVLGACALPVLLRH